MNDLDKLFELLTKTKLYTNSKEEFIEKYSTPENQEKLFNVVSETKLSKCVWTSAGSIKSLETIKAP